MVSFPLTPGKGLFSYIQDFSGLVLVLVVLCLVFFFFSQTFCGFSGDLWFLLLFQQEKGTLDDERGTWEGIRVATVWLFRRTDE